MDNKLYDCKECDCCVNHKTINDNKPLSELVEWLKGERYIIRCNPDEMTEEFEKEHLWELSRNRMIDKTIRKIMELQSK